MDNNTIRRIIRRRLVESFDNEVNCVRSVGNLLQDAKRSLNKALQKLTYSRDYETKTYERIRQIHNALTDLEEGRHLQ